jgi:HPt (histidine-containing phosphotransfer) domain-containing protein
MVQSDRQTVLRVLDFELFQDLLESLGNELGIVAGLYRRFLDNTAATLAELRRQKAETWSKTLHALKGSAGMVGANRIAAVAAELQDSLLHAPREMGKAELDVLESELALFRVTVIDHLESLGHSPAP